MLLQKGGESMDDGDNDGGEDVYNGSVESVLVSLSDLYSEEDRISQQVIASSLLALPIPFTDYFSLPITVLRKVYVILF